MAQDALDHGGVFDHRNELQAPATPGAFEDIEPKAPADELRPETVRRGGSPAPAASLNERNLTPWDAAQRWFTEQVLPLARGGRGVAATPTDAVAGDARSAVGHG